MRVPGELLEPVGAVPDPDDDAASGGRAAFQIPRRVPHHRDAAGVLDRRPAHRQFDEVRGRSPVRHFVTPDRHVRLEADRRDAGISDVAAESADPADPSAAFPESVPCLDRAGKRLGRPALESIKEARVERLGQFVGLGLRATGREQQFLEHRRLPHADARPQPRIACRQLRVLEDVRVRRLRERVAQEGPRDVEEHEFEMRARGVRVMFAHVRTIRRMTDPTTPPGLDADALAARHLAAAELALAAGRRTLDTFMDSTLAVEKKRDGSVVTAADRAAESWIRDELAERFPEDGVLGEEHGERAGSNDWRWVLDPIDGTVSYVHGVPLYGTLIAVEWKGVPVVGVIEMPALDERVHAAIGRGATHARGGHDDVPARVSRVDDVADAVVAVTGLDLFHREPGGMDRLERIIGTFRLVRGWSDCYAHLLAATGRVDAVIEPTMAWWDVAAMIPIMREAGGICTGWDNGPAAADAPCISSNGLVHEAAVRVVAD